MQDAVRFEASHRVSCKYLNYDTQLCISQFVSVIIDEIDALPNAKFVNIEIIAVIIKIIMMTMMKYRENKNHNNCDNESDIDPDNNF